MNRTEIGYAKTIGRTYLNKNQEEQTKIDWI